jgi:hypothetical protein
MILKGIAISLLGNISFDTVMGIQYALFSNESNKPFTGLQRARLGKNYCKGSFTGVQKALISNMIESDLKGSQQALIYNYTAGNVKGTQFSAGVNSCRDTFSGIQFGLVSVTEKDLYGVSICPVTSFCKSEVKGIQMGCLNYSKTLSGVQISPKLNISGSGGVKGLQLACDGNISTGDVNGMQCAVLYNQSKNLNGVQIGLVNKADTVRGIQIGLINCTDDMYGYPIGIFNYSKRGVFSLDIWYDEQALTHFTLQSGTRNFYNLFTAAVRGNGTRAAGFGMGFRIPLKYVSFESDIHHLFTFKHLSEEFETYDITEKARLTIATRFIPMVSISAGPSYNLLFNFDRKQNAEPVVISKRYFERLAQGIYSWPGFHIGIAIGRF